MKIINRLIVQIVTLNALVAFNQVLIAKVVKKTE